MTRPNLTKFQPPRRPIADAAESAQPLSRCHGTTSSALLNEREVASLLHLSVKTLRNWRLNGQGPPFRKISRLVRYSADDLQTWVDLRRRISTSDRGGNVDA